jgi:hypothetical protein
MAAVLINPPIKSDQIAPTARTNPPNPQSSTADAAVRPGVTGASLTTGVPPVAGAPGDPTVSQVDLGAAFASLLRFLPTDDDAEVNCARGMEQCAKMQQKSDNEQVRVSFAKRQEVCAAKLQAAKEMQKELDSVKDSPWWCSVLKVVAVVVAIIATPFTGGGSLALVAAILLAVSMADDALVATTGHGIAGNVCLHICGGSEEDAKKADKVFSVVLGVAMLVVGAVTLICGDTHTAAEGWARLANLAAATASATGTIGAGVTTYQNDGHQAEAKRDRAREQIAQATLDQLDEFVQQVIKRLTTNLGNWSQVRDEATATLADRNYQTARIRFA